MSEVTNAKYAKVIARIQSGTMSRAELSKLKRNAEEKLKQGDAAAQQVLDAMDVATGRCIHSVYGILPGCRL